MTKTGPPAVAFVLPPQRVADEPYTTSEIIAEGANVQHRAIRQLVTKHETDFEEFGVLTFEMSKPLAGSKGGRPETIYHLNEQQATLLMTYLKNTEVVRTFKKELVRQFFLMRGELARRRELRAIGKPIRRDLTDALRDSGEVERMHGHAYATYTNLAYTLSTGKSARQLRQERGAAKDAKAVDLLTASELEVYQRKEAAITVLLDAGLDYDGIKGVLAKPRADPGQPGA